MAKSNEAYTGFTKKDKFAYRAEKMKPGSTYTTASGEVKEYSDFKRGEMAGRNKEIAKSMSIFNFKKNNPNYVKKADKNK